MNNVKFAELISYITHLVGHAGPHLTNVEIDRVQILVQALFPVPPAPRAYTDVDVELYKKAHIHAKAERKIEAIKDLRDAFRPTIGLKEAKDIVESW